MHQKEIGTAWTDAEYALIHQVAQERGVSDDEAASQLLHEFIVQKVRQSIGRPPARAYGQGVH
jgi:hypothetical protein